MNFQNITSEDQLQIQKIYEAYSTAFPPDEQRSYEQFMDLFANDDVSVSMIIDERSEVGYLIIWKFDRFIFLEHFEIFPEYRNRQLGSKVLAQLSQDSQTMILESEPATLNATAAKRIVFYKRNGFSVIEENYVQPPYDSTKNALNLWLLSNKKAEPESVIREIHKKVYGQS